MRYNMSNNAALFSLSVGVVEILNSSETQISQNLVGPEQPFQVSNHFKNLQCG